MEIKIYTIKLNPPRWLRNVIVYGALPVGALLGAAMAVHAGVSLTTFTTGPIKAAEVNANFKALGDAVTSLQASASSVPKVTGWQSYTPVLTRNGGPTSGTKRPKVFTAESAIPSRWTS